ncbi:MAG: sugar ABC transporter ATP-binding protein [Spirochaetaceae bacterium]|jgi:ribose transport system ATP-binding protein|nr:sugar ABC transporter ATP-binding protein [Spirochaetaceae bacterium]
MNILEMKNIGKAFFGVPVLRDIDLSLAEGRVHAIVGGNGAGKSTLMKILTGVYAKDSGDIFLDGARVEFSSYNDAANAGVRMIFQELSVIPAMTVTENIYLNHEQKKGAFIDAKKMQGDARKLLERFHIDIPVNAKLSSLSVGHCQLVEIAKALSLQPKILVMDEPTASLSDGEVTCLFDIVRNLKEAGVSIVYISHRMQEILTIADDITIMRDGTRVVTGETKDFDIAKIIGYMLGEGARHSFEYHERARAENPGTILSVQNLCVDNLVENVSFEVKAGEIIGFAGLMGSGRTEILEALFGIRAMQNGSVSIQGKNATIKSVRDAISAGIALVPEDRRREGLVLTHSILSNLLLALFGRVTRNGIIDREKIKTLMQESKSELNIKMQSEENAINTLSGGNQQKVVIAKWLKNDPLILLLDEPTAGIDIGAKGEIIKIIEDYAAKGNGVIVVSSEIQELMALCDRILVLVDGKLRKEFARKDIANEEAIQNAIQG